MMLLESYSNDRLSLTSFTFDSLVELSNIFLRWSNQFKFGLEAGGLGVSCTGTGSGCFTCGGSGFFFSGLGGGGLAFYGFYLGASFFFAGDDFRFWTFLGGII